MIFDKACKVAERAIPDLTSILNKSKLFWFPGKPHNFLPKEMEDKDMEFLSEQFMLPFPTVAIEDVGGLVILIDKDKESRGINNERYYIDVTSLNTEGSAFQDLSPKKEQEYKKLLQDKNIKDKEPLVITFGAIEGVEFVARDKFYTLGRIERLTVAFAETKDDEIIFSDYIGNQFRSLPEELVTAHLTSALTNAMCAMQEVLYANTPNKFILEESPAKRRKKIKGKILRSGDRPKYTLLSPQKIRKKMKLSETQNGEKQTRLFLGRRAHPRTYHDPRFVNMMGKTVMIPAVWPGDNIKIVGNKRYKVMLDL